VTAAWLNPDRVIKKLYVTETMRDGFAAVLKEGRNLNRPEPTVIDKRQLDNALKKAVHQGIAIDAAPLDEVFVGDIIAKLSTRKSGLILMLDHVTDPHNVGAILRSACAFGADGVIMQRKFSPELTGVLAKTATGAVEHMPVAFEINLSDTLDTLAAAGFYAIGLDERGPQTLGEAVAAYKGEEHLAKTVLVLGAEGSGLRPKVRDHCSALARLPTGGPIESLNVSNAAAIALYALSER
jgi:23S rRNA (guanosine2251-2'-O)-methyltransferase